MTGNIYPGFDGGETFGFGRIRLDGVEDVDEHEEDGNQERHSARYHLCEKVTLNITHDDSWTAEN